MENEKNAGKRSVESILAELGTVPRPEHPRPDRYRDQWMNLNGVWEFALDPADQGLANEWQSGKTTLANRIVVPFCVESIYSGMGDESLHMVCWYARFFDVPDALQNKRLLLHFGAVDYRADVWLNGHFLGRHEGGYDAFFFEIGAIVRPTGNRLVVRVVDDMQESKPRGKQHPDKQPSGCRYMRVTGIWQTVWLEAVGAAYIRDWQSKSDASGRLEIAARIDQGQAAVPVNQFTIIVYDAGRELMRSNHAIDSSGIAAGHVQLANPRLWSPDQPALYDIALVLHSPQGQELDRVRTYAGFRTIEIRDGMYYLNGHPFYWISALDQGYWEESLYTPITDDIQRRDVEWAKRFGLNGIRKHQIIAEPRFYYWCDRLGLTVWEEMPDWGWQCQGIDLDRMMREWMACLRRDINHPSIITWMPLNEAGTDEDANRCKLALYDAAKAIDPTRPVVDASGYHHTRTDICDFHVGWENGAECQQWFKQLQADFDEIGNHYWGKSTRPHSAYCPPIRHSGQPVIISEWGLCGIKTFIPQDLKWKVYCGRPLETPEEFIHYYRDCVLALMREPACAGFSYVQLYDVEGEVNGYLTYDRRPKISPEAIAGIHTQGMALRVQKENIS